jgi:hypothetical protein
VGRRVHHLGKGNGAVFAGGCFFSALSLSRLGSTHSFQDFSIDENATTISFPPGCIASANSAGLAKALSSKRRPHVTAVELQVRFEN